MTTVFQSAEISANMSSLEHIQFLKPTTSKSQDAERSTLHFSYPSLQKQMKKPGRKRKKGGRKKKILPIRTLFSPTYLPFMVRTPKPVSRQNKGTAN